MLLEMVAVLAGSVQRDWYYLGWQWHCVLRDWFFEEFILRDA